MLNLVNTIDNIPKEMAEIFLNLSSSNLLVVWEFVVYCLCLESLMIRY